MMRENVGMASDRIEAEIESRFITDGENLSEVTVQKYTEHNLPYYPARCLLIKSRIHSYNVLALYFSLLFSPGTFE